MSVSDFEEIRAQFGEVDGTISADDFLVLSEKEVDELINRVPRFVDKAKLRRFRLTSGVYTLILFVFFESYFPSPTCHSTSLFSMALFHVPISSSPPSPQVGIFG